MRGFKLAYKGEYLYPGDYKRYMKNVSERVHGTQDETNIQLSCY